MSATIRTTIKLRILALEAAILALTWPPAALAQTQGGAPAKPYAFNVLNQRTIALTAEYWNPILTYVSKKSGVPLELKLAKNAREGNQIAEKAVTIFSIPIISSRRNATVSGFR